MNEPNVDDASLVAALAGGNAKAAHELYRRHCRAILRFALALTDNIATAEDIVHDTFIEVLFRPGNYECTRGSVRTYLYGIARHLIARRLRCTTRVVAEANDAGELAMLPVLALATTPEDETERAQYIERVRAAIGTLPLLYREVIAWCDLEELPYATVADILACPVGTVRSRLHRARALLAATLESAGLQADPAPRPSGVGLPEMPAGIATVCRRGSS
jgi:RNA polymerase sigma factor (sigma-70 family)